MRIRDELYTVFTKLDSEIRNELDDIENVCNASLGFDAAEVMNSVDKIKEILDEMGEKI